MIFFILYPYFQNQSIPICLPQREDTNQNYFFTDFISSTNENDFKSQNWTVFNVNSSLITQNKSKQTGYYDYYVQQDSVWDENNSLYLWSYSEFCNSQIPISHVFEFFFEISDIARAGSFPACYLYFWNYSAEKWQYNNSFIWNINCWLKSEDYLKNSTLKFLINTSSSSWFSIIVRISMDCKYWTYCSKPVIKYQDLGECAKINYIKMNYSTSSDFNSISLLWSSSNDNSSWTSWQSYTSFNGFIGDFILR
ncbi:MAG: hypothetical protein ACTSRG_04715 [Candidatus Helarchaeota archaeon]